MSLIIKNKKASNHLNVNDNNNDNIDNSGDNIKIECLL